MELNDLEKIWKEKDKKLEESLLLNLKLLRKVNLNGAVSEFDKLAKISTLGRNLALIYSIPSIVLSIMLVNDLLYSIPGFIGGLGMLLSYYYHTKTIRPLKNLDYYKTPTLELQKIIGEFKVRSIGASKYDFFTVLVWLLTSIPMVIKVIFKKDLKAYVHPTLASMVMALVVVLILFTINEIMYKKLYNDKLSKAETDLDEIIEFEKN